MRTRRQALALALAGVAPAAQAGPADRSGWRNARWGMTADEIDAAFPAQTRLPAGRLEFGPFVVERQIDIVTLAQREFVALFQMDRRTRTLRQVLLQFRGSRPSRADANAVHEGVNDELGAKGAARSQSDYRGLTPSFALTVEWRFAQTGVLLRYVDPNAEPGSGVRKELIVRYFAL